MTTLKCEISSILLLTNIMKRYLDPLIDYNVKNWGDAAREELLKNRPAFWSIVYQLFQWLKNFNYSSILPDKEYEFDIELDCTNEELGILGLFLDCNLDNIWLTFEVDKMPLEPEVQKRIVAIIKNMRGNLTAKFPSLN